MYKLGYYDKLSALKTRECLAKGMPLITGCAIDVLDDDYEYAKTFSNDSKAVNMLEIIEFFEQIKQGRTKQKVAECIREFAYDHVSIESVMKPIITYIED